VVTVSKDVNNLAELAYQQCGALWHQNSSTLKPNIILLMVKPSTPGKQDGKSLAAAGSMHPEINSQTQNILATMKPNFQSGDYAGGLVAGLRYMQQLAQSNAHPTSNGTNPPEVVTNKPADLTSLWIIVGAIVVLGGLAMLAIFVMHVRRDKKGENEARRVAQQDAKFIRTQAVNAVRELTDKMNDPSLQARIELASQASSANAYMLKRTYESVSTNVSSLSIDLRNVMSSASDPDNDKTVQEYRRIGSYFAPIVREADDLQKRITRLEHQLDEVERNPQVQLGISSRQQRD
jgi:flagellar basal body-associated protein FliL